MSHARIDLNEVERRAFQATLQDGLLEMYLGLIFLGFGMGGILDSVGLPGDMSIVIMMLAVVLLWALREYVVLPRMGRVQFSAARRKKVRNVWFAIMASWYVAFGVLFVAGMRHIGLGWAWLLAIIAAAMLAGFWLPAYFLHIPRLYGYGALLALAMPLIHWVGSGVAVFSAAGGLMALAGIVRLVRFVRDHPVPPAEEETANEFAR